jgi:hypothetical protein
VFFSKSKTAATVGVLLFFATYFPSLAVSDPDVSYGTKVFASLLSPTAFTLGMGVFADQVKPPKATTVRWLFFGCDALYLVLICFTYSVCVYFMFMAG